MVRRMELNLWLWILLALGLFWGVGVYNRISRMRARSLDAFQTVAQYLFQFRLLLLEHVDLARITNAPTAIQQLLRQLDQLDSVTKAAKSRPWDQELQAAVTSVSLDSVRTWGLLKTAPADLAGAALPERLMRDWDENSRFLQTSIFAFNQILLNYNEAVGQFPAMIICNFLGFKPSGQIYISHET